MIVSYIFITHHPQRRIAIDRQNLDVDLTVTYFFLGAPKRPHRRTTLTLVSKVMVSAGQDLTLLKRILGTGSRTDSLKDPNLSRGSAVLETTLRDAAVETRSALDRRKATLFTRF